jgi:hypothetical protein
MLALGLSSKREITRTRIRVRTAMAAQTLEQGRYLGGRPPYGYRLADAGPYPNKAHAAWGRRAHRLEPVRATARLLRPRLRGPGRLRGSGEVRGQLRRGRPARPFDLLRSSGRHPECWAAPPWSSPAPPARCCTLGAAAPPRPIKILSRLRQGT